MHGRANAAAASAERSRLFASMGQHMRPKRTHNSRIYRTVPEKCCINNPLRTHFTSLGAPHDVSLKGVVAPSMWLNARSLRFESSWLSRTPLSDTERRPSMRCANAQPHHLGASKTQAVRPSHPFQQSARACMRTLIYNVMSSRTQIAPHVREGTSTSREIAA